MKRILVVLMLMLAGCSGAPEETVFTVSEDAPSSEDAHVGDGFDLTVRVVDLEGNPIQGAGVVVFRGEAGDGVSYSSGEVDCRDFTCQVSGGVFKGDFNDYEVIAGMRTNAKGEATVDLAPGKAVHVAAGDVVGKTTEALMSVAIGSGGGSGKVSMALFPDTIAHTFTVDVGNIVGQTPFREGQYEAFDLVFSDDPVLDAAFEQRLDDLGIIARWENGMTGGADFYVGAGGKDAPSWEGEDNANVEPGPHEESLGVDSDMLRDARPDTAHVHLITDWVSLGFDGVPVEIEVTATLKGSNFRIQ